MMPRLLLALTAIVAYPTVALSQSPAKTITCAGHPEVNVRPGEECATPRKALCTMLYWLQESTDHHDPKRAARCMSPGHPAAERVVVQLRELLDHTPIYVEWKDIPDDPDYKTGDEFTFRLYPNKIKDINWVRNSTGGWMLSRPSMERIPDMHAETFVLDIGGVVDRLPGWMKRPVLGVTVWQALGTVLLILLALALRRIVLFIFRTYVTRLMARVQVKWLAGLVNRSDGPVGSLLIALIVTMFWRLLRFPIGVNQVVYLGARFLAAFSLVWLAFRVTDVISELLQARADRTDTKLDDQLVPLFRKSVKLMLAIIGGIFIMQNLDIDVGSLLAGLGLGGLAFALAAKDTLANFFGSLMIFVDRPFQVGDWIKIQNVEGTVEEIGFRTTRIRTFYNSLLSFPNANVTTSAIDNLGARRYRRYKATLGLTYDTPPEKVQAFCEGLRAVIRNVEGMRKDYYMVEFQGFGPASLDILLYCFMDVPDWNAELRTRSVLNMEILRLAQDLDVSFAFPTQTLHVETLGQKDRPPKPESVTDLDALASVVNAYGPQGGRGRATGVVISGGWGPGDTAGSRGSTGSDS